MPDLVLFSVSLQALYGGLQAGLLSFSSGEGSIQGSLQAGLLSLSLAPGLSGCHLGLHALLARPVNTGHAAVRAQPTLVVQQLNYCK